MTPEAATRYIESRAVLGMRFGLERMHAVLAALGHPHRCAPALHVVGTNGKSSTTRFAAAMAQAHDLRVGSYVSPHVDGWHERIMLDARPVGAGAFARAVGLVARTAQQVLEEPDDAITQFEVLTAAAFVVFADAGVGAMVVEAGLGGRFDATNVFGGKATVVLTNVALEHTALLGATEHAIAGEKLAVVADGSDRLVVGALSEVARVAVTQICAERAISGWFVGREVTWRAGREGSVDVRTPGGDYPGLPCPMHGMFQRENLVAAVAGVERLLGRPLDRDRLAVASAGVRVPGRLELIAGAPLVILDGAHNPAGLAALVAALPQIVGRRRVVVVTSIFDDKDLAQMARLIARVAHVAVATRSDSPRATPAGALAAHLQQAGIPTTVAPTPTDALHAAVAHAGPDGAVVVCGSLALLAQIRNGIVRARSGAPGMLAAGKSRKSS